MLACTADAASLLGDDSQSLLGDSLRTRLPEAARRILTLFQRSGQQSRATAFTLPTRGRRPLPVVLQRRSSVLVVELLHGQDKLATGKQTPDGEQVALALADSHRVLTEAKCLTTLCQSAAELIPRQLGFAHGAVLRCEPGASPLAQAYADSQPPPLLLLADSESPLVELQQSDTTPLPADALAGCLLSAPPPALLQHARGLGARSLLALRLLRHGASGVGERPWGVLLCWDPRPQVADAATRALAQTLAQFFSVRLDVLSAQADTQLTELRALRAIEASGEPICILDELGNTVLANAAFTALTCQPQQSLRNRYQLAALLAEPGVPERIQQGLQAGDGFWQGETVFHGPQMEPIPIELRVDVASREDGSVVGFVAVCRDLRPSRKAEAERQQMERRLRQSEKLDSLGVLAAGIAHDFNNLLTGILGNTSLLRLEARRSRNTEPYLTQIEETALRAAELCKQMLAYAGKGHFQVRPLHVNELVEETLSLLDLEPAWRQALQLRLAVKLPAVRGDAVQLRQVLGNLLRNAIESLAPRPVPQSCAPGSTRSPARSGHNAGQVTGPVLPQITIATELRSLDAEALRGAHGNSEARPGEYVALEVSDTGCGITQEVQARMFEPFFSTKPDGRGLGLSTVIGIVRRHGGVLRVHSEVARGSTLTVLLPPDRPNDRTNDRTSRAKH